MYVRNLAAGALVICNRFSREEENGASPKLRRRGSGRKGPGVPSKAWRRQPQASVIRGPCTHRPGPVLGNRQRRDGLFNIADSLLLRPGALLLGAWRPADCVSAPGQLGQSRS